MSLESRLFTPLLVEDMDSKNWTDDVYDGAVIFIANNKSHTRIVNHALPLTHVNYLIHKAMFERLGSNGGDVLDEAIISAEKFSKTLANTWSYLGVNISPLMLGSGRDLVEHESQSLNILNFQLRGLSYLKNIWGRSLNIGDYLFVVLEDVKIAANMSTQHKLSNKDLFHIGAIKKTYFVSQYKAMVSKHNCLPYTNYVLIGKFLGFTRSTALQILPYTYNKTVYVENQSTKIVHPHKGDCDLKIELLY
jgi:hypothetical protein